MTTITMTTLAAAVVALMAFGTAASASEGEFYEGLEGSYVERGTTDAMTTGSIVLADASGMSTRWPVDRGDYYQGASRPQ